MKNLKFSIVIPSYNQGIFIEQTLTSIISQKYENLEIIVIDGGSTDNTTSILKKYSSHITYWQSKPDNGQSDAIAIGFSLATGDILSWLNSDDIYHPSALQEVNNTFLETDAEVVYGNMYLINESGQVVSERYLTTFLPECLRDAYLCGGFGIYQPASFWRRSIYEKVGGLDKSFRFCMDNDLFNRFVIFGAKFKFIDDFLAGFRIHSESKTSTLSNIAKSEGLAIYDKYVTKRNIKFPLAKKLFAKAYRFTYLTARGRFFDVLKNKISGAA